MVSITNVKQPAVQFDTVSPVLSVFDVTEAKKFYCEFLGFSVEATEDHLGCLYVLVSRDDVYLYLTKDEARSSTGTTVCVRIKGVKPYARELSRKGSSQRTAVKPTPWGNVLEISDPFGNILLFCESS